MFKPKAILFIILLLTSLSYCKQANCQSKNRIGLSVVADKANDWKIRAGFGFSFERMVNKRNSAEIGIYYRSAIDDKLIIYVPNGTNFTSIEQFFILEKFISIPLLYNYRSNFVNISIGPTVDIYTGWKEKRHATSPPSTYVAPLQNYKFDNKLLWGAMAKVSKSIKLTDNLLLEPYIYYNPVLTSYRLYTGTFSGKREYFGAAFTIKYIL